jgi:predicted NAD/FAD-dependent oxidoreductase
MEQSGVPGVRIAIVGAGLSGLACAQALARADAKVTVFEKSRGLGGRLATRRVEEAAFDHGAQFVTARGAAFARYLEFAARSGHAATWAPTIEPAARATAEGWRVGVAGMSALVQPLARGLAIERASRIVDLRRVEREWRLETAAGLDTRRFDAVVLAIPPAQASELLDEHASFNEALAGVELAPCWSALVTFPQATGLAADVLLGEPGAAVAWAARENSKPGRAAAPEAWVLHAGPDWSRTALDADSQSVATRLLHDFGRLAGTALPAPSLLLAHRWRHARVERALGATHLLDRTLALGLCGDWCLAARAEAAFDSGQALAAALVERFDLPRRLAPQ